MKDVQVILYFPIPHQNNNFNNKDTKMLIILSTFALCQSLIPQTQVFLMLFSKPV